MYLLVRDELGEEIFEENFSLEEVYWVDYLREPPEATGDEPEDFCFDAPKVYEEIPSWEFLLEKTKCDLSLLLLFRSGLDPKTQVRK